MAVIWKAVPMIPWLQSIAKPILSALVITSPSSWGQIKDSGPIDAEALAELETVEEPVAAAVEFWKTELEPDMVEEPVAVAVEFWKVELEPEAVLAVLEELELFERDSTVAKVIPGALRWVVWRTSL